jgi:hypothetical protein
MQSDEQQREEHREVRRKAQEILGTPPPGRTFILSQTDIKIILDYQKAKRESGGSVPVPEILREFEEQKRAKRAGEAVHQDNGL